MGLALRKVHPLFAAEAGPVAQRQVRNCETLERIRAGMDEYSVPVFRNQPYAEAG